MRSLLYVLAIVPALLAGTPAAAKPPTYAQATTCLSKMVASAKAGSTMPQLIGRYLVRETVITRAAKRSQLSRTALAQALSDTLSDDSSFRRIDLSTVKPVRGGKARTVTYELAGRYRDRSGTKHAFTLLVDRQCRVHDAAWNNLWLSVAIR